MQPFQLEAVALFKLQHPSRLFFDPLPMIAGPTSETLIGPSLRISPPLPPPLPASKLHDELFRRITVLGGSASTDFPLIAPVHSSVVCGDGDLEQNGDELDEAVDEVG